MLMPITSLSTNLTRSKKANGSWRQCQTPTPLIEHSLAKKLRGRKSMIYFLPANKATEALLLAGRALINRPEFWCKEVNKTKGRLSINRAMFQVGTPCPDLPKEFSSDHKLYYRGDLPRGSIPEPFWFLREAVKILTEGQFDSVGRFEDDPLTEHTDVILVMDIAIDLVRLEMELTANLQPTYH